MSWVRNDDQMPIHRKIAPLDDAAFRLVHEALCWCSRNKTDGRIADEELDTISKRATPGRAAQLVKRGIWHEAGRVCDNPQCPPSGVDGWVIHDYLDFNPSKRQVEADLAAKAERTRAWRERKKNPPGDVRRDASRDGPRDASRDMSRDAYGDGTRDGARDASPSRPVPPRPEGGGGGAPGAPPAAHGGREPAGSEPNQKPSTSRPVPSNGRPDLAAAKAAIAAAKANSHRPPAASGALERLRDATPDTPPDLITEPQPEAGAA